MNALYAELLENPSADWCLDMNSMSEAAFDEAVKDCEEMIEAEHLEFSTKQKEYKESTKTVNDLLKDNMDLNREIQEKQTKVFANNLAIQRNKNIRDAQERDVTYSAMRLRARKLMIKLKGHLKETPKGARHLAGSRSLSGVRRKLGVGFLPSLLKCECNLFSHGTFVILVCSSTIGMISTKFDHPRKSTKSL